MVVSVGSGLRASATAATTTIGTDDQTCLAASGSTLRSSRRLGTPLRDRRYMVPPTRQTAVTAGTCWYTSIGDSGNTSETVIRTAKPTNHVASEP